MAHRELSAGKAASIVDCDSVSTYGLHLKTHFSNGINEKLFISALIKYSVNNVFMRLCSISMEELLGIVFSVWNTVVKISADHNHLCLIML